MLKKAAFFTPRKGGIASADADVAAWIAAVGAANTNPGEVAALTAMVTGLKSDFAITLLSQKWDRLWVYCLGTAAAAAVDLAARASHTPVNGPTFTPLQGYTGNGTSSYINTGYNPATGGIQYTQNNAGFGIDIAVADSRGSGAFYAYAGSDTQSRSNTIDRSSTNTQWAWGVNNTSTDENTNFSAQTGVVYVERTGGAGGASAIYQAGVSLGAGANASNSVISASFLVLAGNNGSGSANQWTNGRVRGFFTSAALGSTGEANFNTRWGALKTALGAS